MTSELTPEQIKSADIALQPAMTPEDQILEAKIKTASKGIPFSMSLTLSQQQLMERFALTQGLTWQQYLRQQIDQKILGLNAMVGGPLITGPSFAKNSKIRGPQL